MNYKHISLAFIFTAILLASICVVYAFQQQKINDLLLQRTPIITPVPTDASQAEVLTKAWKTYKHPTLSFQFEYPNTWVVDSNPSIISHGVTLYPRGYVPQDHDDSPTFSCTRNGYNREIDSKKYNKLISSTSIYDIFYNQSEIYSFIDKNSTFVCFMETQTTASDYLDIFPQILSTFKFTDSTSTIDTTNWKTYKNNQHGFEFQYPDSFAFNNVEYRKYTSTFGDWVEAFETQKPNCTEIGCWKFTFFSKKSTKISDRQATIYESTSECGRNMTVYVDLSNYNLAQVKFCLGDPEVPINEAKKLIFDQILSTFKFTQ